VNAPRPARETHRRVSHTIISHERTCALSPGMFKTAGGAKKKVKKKRLFFVLFVFFSMFFDGFFIL
jgi:hypothetical protein